MEWISTTGLGTDALLPDTDAADYYLGAYATSDGVYINPAKAVTDSSNKWKSSTIAFAHDETDPSTRYPGSIGDAIYYSRAEGPYKET